MRRSVLALGLALALGGLPIVHDVCGPECAMGDAPAVVATAADPGTAECPLHPSEGPLPEHERDGCTHDHIVRDAPDSTSALAPSVYQPLRLPVTALSSAILPMRSPHVVRAAAWPPFAHAPRSLALRI